MEVKSPITIKQQVKLLESRGLVVENEKDAENFLKRVNYYTVSGYLHAFKDGENFKDGITMTKLKNIYQCDKRFKNIILYAIDEIEQNLKTKIAYELAHKAGALCHEDVSNFKSEESFEKFSNIFKDVIKHNSNVPFVKHHIDKYESHFPIWVAVNLFTLGTLEHFYNNLETRYQKCIAKDLKVSVPILQDRLRAISYLRNMAAHYMRLYNFKLSIIPMLDRNTKEFPKPTHRVFDIIYIMKYLYPVPDEWLHFILPSIEQIFDEYKEYIDIRSYGFHDNWKSLLNKIPCQFND